MEDKMDLGFKGRVALITGTANKRGYGYGIATYMAKEGCDIINIDWDGDGVKIITDEIKAMGRKSIGIKCDVSSIPEVDAMIKTAIAEFGKIDILVNNASTSTVLKPFLETTKAEFDKLISINLWGAMNVTRVVAPHMVARKYGRIVNITGGQGGATISLYGAAKAGVDSFTRSIAAELLPYGIIANAVHPGLGDTGLNALGRGGRYLTKEEHEKAAQMFGLKRFCTGEDMGPMVAFLASDVCSYLVGQTISMTGGAPQMKFP
jgi:NAD(P)-dependent dehydrogenase (short-subunit alcohol dehydrogenase family)